MYLDYYKMKEYPFSMTPNVDYYFELPSHKEALNVLLLSLHMKDGIIKVTGETGTGKTLICNLLLKKLDSSYFTIYLPNPYLSHDELMVTLCDELKITYDNNANQNQLYKAIYNRLLEIVNSGKHVVVIFDEAQALSGDMLESIRIISNMETNNRKLLQIVLIGGNELDKKIKSDSMRHLQQRITFSYSLAKMQKESISDYITHRLEKSSKGPSQITITPSAVQMLYRNTKGSPRLINTLCHKALLAAYGKGERVITHQFIKFAIDDTEMVARRRNKIRRITISAVLSICVFVTVVSFITLI